MNLELRNSGKNDLGNRELSGRIIAAAIAVHQTLGPGYLESIYEAALAVEFDFNGVPYERQKPISISYRAVSIGEHRLDFLVSDAVIVELKAVTALDQIYFSIVRSYLKATNLHDALLLNFATMPLTIKRVGRERVELDSISPKQIS